MSLGILILKKQQFSKLQKIDQSYPVGAIKAAMEIGGSIQQCRCKCSPMFGLRRQKNAIVKVLI